MERIVTSPTILLVLVLGLASCSQDPAPISAEAEVAEPAPVEAAPILVDRSNYQEAEVSRNFNRWAANGANNKLMHMTDVTPTGPAPTVRMNRDSLYSAAILDTSTGNASVALPEGDLYQSVLMVDTEGYARGFILVPGTHPVPMDTQFIWVLVRTGLEKGMEEARRMQSLISVQGMGDGQYS